MLKALFDALLLFYTLEEKNFIQIKLLCVPKKKQKHIDTFS